MVQINNRLERDLTQQERECLVRCASEVSDAFERRVYQVTVHPDRTNGEKIFGLFYSFDLKEQGAKRGTYAELHHA